MMPPAKASCGPPMSTQRTQLRVALLAALVLAVGGEGSQALGQNPPEQKSAGADIAEVHLGRGYDALTLHRYEDAASEFRSALQRNSHLVLKARFPLAIAL